MEKEENTNKFEKIFKGAFTNKNKKNKKSQKDEKKDKTPKSTVNKTIKKIKEKFKNRESFLENSLKLPIYDLIQSFFCPNNINKELKRLCKLKILQEISIDISKESRKLLWLTVSQGQILKNQYEKNYFDYLDNMENCIYYEEQIDKDIFWIFTALVERILRFDYFALMNGILSEAKILEETVKKMIPDLFIHLSRIHFDISIVAIPWFVCLFTNSKLNQNIIYIIWDFMLLEGEIALFKASIVILKLLKEDIKQAKDFPEALFVIETKISEIEDYIGFKRELSNISFHKKKFKRLRENYLLAFKTIKIENNLRKMSSKLGLCLEESTLECDSKLPTCTHLIEKLKKEKTPFEQYLLQIKYPINCIKNYLDLVMIEKISKEIKKNIIVKDRDIIIGRQEHICKKGDHHEGLGNYVWDSITEVNEETEDIEEIDSADDLKIPDEKNEIDSIFNDSDDSFEEKTIDEKNKSSEELIHRIRSQAFRKKKSFMMFPLIKNEETFTKLER